MSYSDSHYLNNKDNLGLGDDAFIKATPAERQKFLADLWAYIPSEASPRKQSQVYKEFRTLQRMHTNLKSLGR
jgi:hypothetical protein